MNYFDQATVDELNRLARMAAEAPGTDDPGHPAPEPEPPTTPDPKPVEAHHLGLHHG